MAKLVVCGTGHRPNKLGGYSKEAFNKIVSVLSDWLSEKSNKINTTINNGKD